MEMIKSTPLRFRIVVSIDFFVMFVYLSYLKY
jgi:hypothetical protein